MENKKYISKLAVFDLDGTLWEPNSHIDIVNKYYKTTIFSSPLYKAYSKIFPKGYLKLLNKKYKKIPKDYIVSYKPVFRESALTLLEQKKNDGYLMLIASNAPVEIVETAANRLSLDFIRADASQKYDAICRKYQFDYLLVCTDNKSDWDLLEKADKSVIYTHKRNKKFFVKHYPDALFMEK